MTAALFLRLFCGCLMQLIPFGLLCLYPFRNHFRLPNRTVLFISCALVAALGTFFAAFCTLLTFFVQHESRNLTANLVFMLCLLFCLGWYLYIVKDIWQKKLFVFTFIVIVALSTTSLVNSLSTYLERNTVIDGLPYSTTSVVVLALFTVIATPLLFLLLKKEFMPVADYLNPKEYRTLCCLSLIIFTILASGLIPIEYTYMANPMSAFLYIALMCSTFLIYYVVFHLFRLSKDQMLTEKKLHHSEMQLQLQNEQYRQLIDTINETRRMRHDSRHYLLTLRQYAQAHDIDHLLAELDSHIESIDQLTITRFCDNELVNTLLSHYQNRCQDSGISMTVQIRDCSDLTMKSSDLAVLLGNLLENACTAAENAPHENRFITLHLLRKGKMFVITVDNSFDGSILCTNGQYRSIKPAHTGIGMDSILLIAQSYSGGAQFTHEETVFHSSVMVRC